eukprot:TRINITY_DN22155_c0_g1_i1.p1 TRINITY_DN22155_c0_g1~~TRINITY_DN22155_c0_g1_i1.p1  ORF type:complete len:652 (+),score=114.19 TRINITY_DN22155_c0_g1_i1:46-2001(+)
MAAPFSEHLAALASEYQRLQLENERLRAAFASETIHKGTAFGDDFKLSVDNAEGAKEVIDLTADEAAAPAPQRVLEPEACHAVPRPPPLEEMEATVPDSESRTPKRGSPLGVWWQHLPQTPRGFRMSNMSNFLVDIFRDGQSDGQSCHSSVDTTGGRVNATKLNLGDLKNRVRSQIIEAEERYDVTSHYKTKGCCQRIARSSFFEHTTLFLIGLYAIWMAVDADYNSGTNLSDTGTIFIVADQLFCTLFTAELFVRFGAFERKMDCIKDAWFLFDSFLLIFLLADTWVLNVVLLLRPGMTGGQTSMLAIAKVFRLARLLRMARLLRAVPELMIIVRATFAAARTVFCALALLIMVSFILGIACKLLMVGTKVGTDKFPNVLKSMHTLIIHGAFLDDINDIMDALIDEQAWVGVVIMYITIIVCAITVMNMMIGILCEVISAVAGAEKDAAQISGVKDVIRRCMTSADGNGDSMLDQEEFYHLLEVPSAIRAFQSIEVDPVALTQYADVIFGDQDVVLEGDKKLLPFSRFMEIILALRGSNTATVKDLIDLRKWIDGSYEMVCVDNTKAKKERSPAAPSATFLDSIIPCPVLEPLADSNLSEFIQQDSQVGDAETEEDPVHPGVNQPEDQSARSRQPECRDASSDQGTKMAL